jgi:hypothetical protein
MVSGPPVPLLVRGEYEDPSVDRAQCEAFRRRFPDWARYGLSAYAAHSDDEVQQVAADQLERFPALSLFRTATLEAAGFEVVATFRSPHMTIAFTGDLDARLRQLAGLRLELRPNPRHDG